MEFIPFDNILEILNDLTIKESVSFFSSDKYLVGISNDHRILRYLAEKHHLPYVSSFGNLASYLRMNRLVLFDHAIGIEDRRLIDYYKNKYQDHEYICYALEYHLMHYIRYSIRTKEEKEYTLMTYITNIMVADSYDIIIYLTNNTEYINSKILYLLLTNLCLYGNRDIFMKLIPLIDMFHDKGRVLRKCIHNTSASGNIDIVQKLIELGAVITPGNIRRAINMGCIDIVKYFAMKEPDLFVNTIELEKNLGAIDTDDLSIINPEMVLYLHSMGVEYNRNALLQAIQVDRLDLVEVLIENIGIKIETIFFVEIKSESMLEYIFHRSRLEDGRLMIDKHFDIVIDIAVSNGYINTLTKLYNENYIFSQYAIVDAIHKGYCEVVEFVLKNGVIATTFLLEEAFSKDRVDMKMVKLLVKYGAKVRGRSIIEAKKRGNNEVVKYLESSIIY